MRVGLKIQTARCCAQSNGRAQHSSVLQLQSETPSPPDRQQSCLLRCNRERLLPLPARLLAASLAQLLAGGLSAAIRPRDKLLAEETKVVPSLAAKRSSSSNSSGRVPARGAFCCCCASDELLYYVMMTQRCGGIPAHF